MPDLPTVELIEGALYWVKHRYEDPETWTVAKWEHGCFWGLSGKEFLARVISGPIPAPENHLQGEGQ